MIGYVLPLNDPFLLSFPPSLDFLVVDQPQALLIPFLALPLSLDSVDHPLSAGTGSRISVLGALWLGSCPSSLNLPRISVTTPQCRSDEDLEG